MHCSKHTGGMTKKRLGSEKETEKDSTKGMHVNIIVFITLSFFYNNISMRNAHSFPLNGSWLSLLILHLMALEELMDIIGDI